MRANTTSSTTTPPWRSASTAAPTVPSATVMNGPSTAPGAQRLHDALGDRRLLRQHAAAEHDGAPETGRHDGGDRRHELSGRAGHDASRDLVTPRGRLERQRREPGQLDGHELVHRVDEAPQRDDAAVGAALDRCVDAELGEQQVDERGRRGRTRRARRQPRVRRAARSRSPSRGRRAATPPRRRWRRGARPGHGRRSHRCPPPACSRRARASPSSSTPAGRVAWTRRRPDPRRGRRAARPRACSHPRSPRRSRPHSPASTSDRASAAATAATIAAAAGTGPDAVGLPRPAVP